MSTQKIIRLIQMPLIQYQLQMTSLQDIEIQLKKQAQLLGDLNMELNQYIENNQKISKEIIELQTRVSKKKKMVEQQNKDKKIIHQKLIDAQNQKQTLEIYAETPQDTPEEPQQSIEQEIKRPMSLDQYKEDKVESKVIPKTQANPGIKKQEQLPTEFDNPDKGGYVPPVLSFDNKSEDSSSSENRDEDDKQVLQTIRSKLQYAESDPDDD